MEITVGQHDLLPELLLLQGAAERKTTIPILSHILAEAAPEGRLQLAATDLELAIETSCPATVKKSGACAVPARKLLDYVRLLPDTSLSLKRQENHWVQLRCGRANTRMVGMARENFPALSAFPAAGVVRIPAAPLLQLLHRTAFAIANEEQRYTLNGALLVLKNNSITLVATDGHRLAHAANEHVTMESPECRVLVPKKAMGVLATLLTEADEAAGVEFAQDDTHLFFRLAHGPTTRMIAVRKLSGQFPNFEAVLPKNNQISVSLKRSELADALRRVAQFADERSHAVRLKLEKGRLKISASASDMGESDEEMDASYDGEELTVGFNAQYLAQFLDVVDSDEVALELKDEQSAGQLRPVESDGMQYRYVVMPMRV